MHFTNKGHSLTRHFLWQGAFYAQGALGNAQHLNPLVFQKTFRCPTFITVTVTDNRSFHFPKQFLEFASVFFDCSTVQCLDITFISGGTFLPFNDRTLKICDYKFVRLPQRIFKKIYYRILSLRNLIIL